MVAIWIVMEDDTQADYSDQLINQMILVQD